MLKIGISADLEKRLRSDSSSLVAEVVALLDKARAATEKSRGGGLGYRDILTLFRAELGDSLALPPNPSTGWIIRQVGKAKELGLDAESIGRLCTGARRLYPRGPYDLEFLLRSATRLISGGGAATAGAGPSDSRNGAPTNVRTGRPDYDGDD